MNFETPKVLYIFFSHQDVIQQVKHNIQKQLKDKVDLEYVVVKGGHEDHYSRNDKVVTVNCNDKYEGLPEKVLKTFRYITNTQCFDKYTHFVKLDEDMKVIRPIPPEMLCEIKYDGNFQRTEGNRKWHIGKCSSNSRWNNLEYKGPYVPWCKGGYGYIISRCSIDKIKNDETYEEHIYEDLYIALLLNNRKIYPTSKVKLSTFFKSPDHH